MIAIHLAPFLLLAALSAQASNGAERTVEGTLLVRDGNAFLEVAGNELRLSSDRRSIQRTLEDARNSRKVLRVTGVSRGTGVLEVHDFLVVRGDKVYRLVYYCNT